MSYDDQHHAFYCDLKLDLNASHRGITATTHQKIAAKFRRTHSHRAQRHDLIRNMMEEHQRARDRYLYRISGTGPRRTEPPKPGVHPAALVDPRADVHPGATIEEGAKIGAYAKIGSKAFIGKNAVIGERTTIGTQAILREGAEVGADCRIGRHTLIAEVATVGDRTIIRDGGAFDTDDDLLASRVHNGYGAAGALKTSIEPGSSIGNDCDLGFDVLITQNVQVGDHALLGNTVRIYPNTTIDKNARIEADAVIDKNCEIGRDATIGRRTRVGENSKLGDDVVIYPDVTLANNSRIEAETTMTEEGPLPDGHRLPEILSDVLTAPTMDEDGDIVPSTDSEAVTRPSAQHTRTSIGHESRQTTRQPPHDR